MTRRTLLVALACLLVLSGCLGGLNSSGTDAGPATTTQVEANAETETTATGETATEIGETTTMDGTTTETAETTTAITPRRATYDTYDALAANTSLSVPDPEVPSDFAFQSGIVMELDGGEHVAAAYHRVENGSLENVVSIRKAENESAFDLRAGNATTVGDRDARYVESDGGAKLVWQCESYGYRVSVQQYTEAFGEEELRAVAESVACE